jgi:hypothetical protein
MIWKTQHPSAAMRCGEGWRRQMAGVGKSLPRGGCSASGALAALVLPALRSPPLAIPLRQVIQGVTGEK